MHSEIKTPEIEALLLRLRRRAQRLGATRGDAEDMAQETVLRLFQRMKQKEVKAPAHYAMTILHNLARARWRTAIDLAPLEDDDISTQPVATSRLAIADLQRAIRALPDDQAQVMHMILQGEVSPTEIAAQLDLPLGTVMSRLARARVKLRAHIGLGSDGRVSELL
ncbi:RNA polymerase sigma factor [uncultured Sulfitobacter sp.]|uniref:RNA polymerase sigma factor n=1 Tax=uncultured Sulfitobacter sp. TaxID=191468 RepID=UPI0026265E98|nr:RNA polymerase sigma factor [uncultured Sulfitobacter sp.]